MFVRDALVLTVPAAGFAGLSNGALLRRAAGAFDVLITTDKSIAYQQNLAAYPLAFVLLRCKSNDIVDVAPVVTKLLERFGELETGKLLVIE